MTPFPEFCRAAGTIIRTETLVSSAPRLSEHERQVYLVSDDLHATPETGAEVIGGVLGEAGRRLAGRAAQVVIACPDLRATPSHNVPGEVIARLRGPGILSLTRHDTGQREEEHQGQQHHLTFHWWPPPQYIMV